MKNFITPEEQELLDKLWKEINDVVHDGEHFDVPSLEQKLLGIEEIIQWLIKETLIKNIRQSKVDILYANAKGIKLEMDTNNFPHILSTKDVDRNNVEKKWIHYATQWKIDITVSELKKLLESKKNEQAWLDDILRLEVYDDVVKLLEIKCMKIQNQILSYERQSGPVDFNRIGYLFYYLIMKLGHKLKVFGNEHEVYIYDKQQNKTIICSNIRWYTTYIADGEKDIYDISEYNQADIEREFTLITFTNTEDRVKMVKTIYGAEKPTKEKSSQAEDNEHKQEESHVTPKMIEKTEPIKKELSDVLSAEDEFIISEGKKESLEELWEKNVVMKDILKQGYKEFMEINKIFDGKKFMEYMKQKNIENFPNKLSSFHKYFGKTPYIFKHAYTWAILADDAEAIRIEEKKSRDDWHRNSAEQKNMDIKDEFAKYFALSDNEQKAKFAKEKRSDFFKNFHVKSTFLGWLPIGDIWYIKSIIENDLEKRFRYEQEYIHTRKMGVYSKVCSDLLAECKEKHGDKYLTYIWEFLKNYNKSANENGKKQYDTSKAERSTEYTRKSWDELDMKSILEVCEKIFDKDENWKYVVSPKKYTEYLKNNPNEQRTLPKNIYDLIKYFKGRDDCANNMICSVKYFEALVNNDPVKIQSERIKYMEKKIEESKNTNIQIMLMYVRRYMEKFWDKSAFEWWKYASKTNIAKIKERNKDISIIYNNIEAIASYCVIDEYTDFNKMDFTSLQSIIRPKIEEIKKLKPTIAALDFSFVTTD